MGSTINSFQQNIGWGRIGVWKFYAFFLGFLDLIQQIRQAGNIAIKSIG